jgi:CHAD domain-containing protein
MRTGIVGSRTSHPPRLVASRAKPTQDGRLLRLVDEHLEQLSSVIGPVLASDDENAVHDLRVITRRLQQLLAVITPTPPPKRLMRLRKQLRRTRRALGAWRNYDVTLETVGKRQRATRSPRRRAVWRIVRDHLREHRLEELIRVRRELLGDDLVALAPRLRAAFADSIATAPFADVDRAVRVRAEAAWQEWQAAFARAEATPDVTCVHALRIATKRLRYRVEVARGLGETAAEPVVDWTRRVQHHLGDWHDHQILQQLMAEALAKPEFLLSAVDVAATGIAELARERAAAPSTDSDVLRSVSVEEGRKAVSEWLSLPAAARPL